MLIEATIGIAALAIVFLIVFYRDPSRHSPPGNTVASPADGKIIGIIPYGKELAVRKGTHGIVQNVTEGGPKKGVIIAIFMRVWDVHVNRCPVEGKVMKVRHQDGKFQPAQRIQWENEKNEILLKHKTLGVIKVIQVAGLIARRIICFSTKGEMLKKGQRLGKIVLGSQVLLVLPHGVEIMVKKGDFVKAGESVVARY